VDGAGFLGGLSYAAEEKGAAEGGGDSFIQGKGGIAHGTVMGLRSR